jgi:hypothetical protein
MTAFLKKHTGKITAAVVLIGLLAAAWFGSPSLTRSDASATGADVISTEPSNQQTSIKVPGSSEKDGNTCTLTVDCSIIWQNIEKLAADKHEILPPDGIIFPPTEVSFSEGESVFDVLQRTMQQNKIHFEFVKTPVYNSAYIEGINNIYEFDCGELSGWMYKVNDWYPNYGCSQYILQDGDVVEWIYSCDLGQDIGGNSATGEAP